MFNGDLLAEAYRDREWSSLRLRSSTALRGATSNPQLAAQIRRFDGRTLHHVAECDASVGPFVILSPRLHSVAGR